MRAEGRVELVDGRPRRVTEELVVRRGQPAYEGHERHIHTLLSQEILDDALIRHQRRAERVRPVNPHEAPLPQRRIRRHVGVAQPFNHPQRQRQRGGCRLFRTRVGRERRLDPWVEVEAHRQQEHLRRRGRQVKEFGKLRQPTRQRRTQRYLDGRLGKRGHQLCRYPREPRVESLEPLLRVVRVRAHESMSFPSSSPTALTHTCTKVR